MAVRKMIATQPGRAPEPVYIHITNESIDRVSLRVRFDLYGYLSEELRERAEAQNRHVLDLLAPLSDVTARLADAEAALKTSTQTDPAEKTAELRRLVADLTHAKTVAEQEITEAQRIANSSELKPVWGYEAVYLTTINDMLRVVDTTERRAKIDMGKLYALMKERGRLLEGAEDC